MRASITSLVLHSAVFALLISGAFVTNVAAEPAKPPPRPAAKMDVRPALQKLKSGDEAQIRAALDDLRIAATAGAAAASAVSDLLARGLSDSLARQAIDTLGDLESPD